jgi:anti-sigma28 factor (negative regulator of flagellin synthesis)
MRINDADLKNIASQPVKGKEPNRVESGYGRIRDASTDPASGATDTFTLSSLSTAINAQSEDSPERTAKLEKLAKDVESGRYQPDSKATSKKLIEEALLAPETVDSKPVDIKTEK